ncbi:MAG TPA: glycoside hydrolase family 38 C-terminal domain-containing protein, partial [Bacteroidota bacterium]|nr:glycoside hydrolase family 38 C-terminal domain-containing protein [Bacteroidota bacterium]
SVPVEFEYMIDHVPKLQGVWHPRLFALDGAEIPVQEESAESLLLPNEWRRKISFNASLPGVGAAYYRIEMAEGPGSPPPAPPMVRCSSSGSGLIEHIDAGGGREVLAGEAMKGLLVEDLADSWGMEVWNYRNVLGEFSPVPGTPVTLENGPVRSVTESVSACGGSKIICRTIAFSGFPFLEFRFRVHWNEERKRLKLAIPTVFRSSGAFCEVPGGAARRPADGEEYVQGCWMVVSGRVGGKPTALGIVNSGQYGFDLKDGEIRLSVLRSAIYCHEHSFDPGQRQYRKQMDQGIHEFRILLVAGDTKDVLQSVTPLADWLSAPPYVLPHFPIGDKTPARRDFMGIEPGHIRLTACKRSWDGAALVIRFQETLGEETRGVVRLENPALQAELSFRPYEIKTIRVERDGTWSEAMMIEEEALSIGSAARAPNPDKDNAA